MYTVNAAHLTQRIRERCGVERSRIITPAEALAAASAGAAWALALLSSIVPGYYDAILRTSDLTLGTGTISTVAPVGRLRSIACAPPGSTRFRPLRVVDVVEAFDLAPLMTGTEPAIAALSHTVAPSVGTGILLGPLSVDASQWDWLLLVSLQPRPFDAQSDLPLPSPLWEEAIVVYGSIQVLEKQELPTGPLWTHLQALEARLREISLSRADSGQAGVRERRLEPLEESLW